MMDYRFHAAALDSFREQLALSNLADTQVGALRDQHISDADQAPEAALLGSMIDHLIWHAASDGRELELVQRAAALWKDGIGLYDALAEFRGRLETALSAPTDGAAVQDLNAASGALQRLVPNVVAQLDNIEQLRVEVAKMPHLRPHPRQRDLPVTEWTWDNVFLARRTEAFLRVMRRRASDTETGAFAFGVLSSYGANAAGSAYLGQVVGGPRRGHRYRDRLARNSVGSWVARNVPDVPALSALARQLKRAYPAGLSASIEDLMRSAVSGTYHHDQVPALPDLKTGYQRLLRHLELLDSFALPPEPLPPQEPFLSRLFGDPRKPYAPSMPEGTGLVEAGVPGATPGSNPGAVIPLGLGTDDGPDHSEPPPSTEVKCGAFWEALGWSLLFFFGGWIACVIRWKDHERCPLWDNITQNWERAFPDGIGGAAEISSGAQQALTSSDVAKIAQGEQVAQLIGDLHNLQSLMWEGFQKAYDFLALFGLIYPDGLLDRWRYSQYLAIPAVQRGTWPRLPEAGTRFDEYPTTGTELPASFSLAYATATTPAAVLARVPEAGTVSAADLSMAVWEQMARDIQDSNNLDLDADRGWRHPCWTARGSINDQPIDVVDLGYDEI